MCWYYVFLIILLPTYKIISKTNLNTLTPETMSKLYFSPEQIKEFFDHKQKYGDFININELYTLPSFDDSLIRQMDQEYYVPKRLSDPYEYDPKLRDKKVLVDIRYARNKWGGDHLGAEDKRIIKVKYQDFKNFRAGLLGFKNPGEESFVFDTPSARILFNSYNCFAEWQSIAFFNNIIIGNFKVGSGQGLVFDSAFGFGKPLDWMKPIVIEDGITPSLSTYKCKFTGIANTIVYGPVKISSFISYNLLDANIRNARVFSVKRRNDYVSKQDLKKRNTLQEFTVGGIVQYIHPSDDFEIGVNIVHTIFNKWFDLSNNANLDYLFNGRLNTNASIFSRWLIGSMHLFVEYARSFKNIPTKNNVFVQDAPDALIVGHMTSIFKNFDWSCVFRKYNPTYYNFYGRGMFVNGGSNCSGLHGCACNEVGCYNAFLLKILPRLEMNACIDFFAVLYKAYNYDEMKGHDARWRINYSFFKYDYVRLEVRHNYKSKEKNDTLTTTQRLLVKINTKVSYDIITSFTQIQIPFNLLQKTHKPHFCLYECVDVDLEYCKVAFFFIISNVSKETPVWLREKGNKTWNKIDFNCSKIGFYISYKFSCNIKMNIVLYFSSLKILPGLRINIAYEF